MQQTGIHGEGSDESANRSSSRELLCRFIENEAETLVKTLGFYVYRAGLAQGTEAREMAYELLSEVVVEALRRPERFDPGRPPRAWLLGIGANIIKRRKEQARKLLAEVSVSDTEPTGHNLSDDELFERIAATSTSDAADDIASRSAAAEMLALVSEADQRVIRLAILHSLDGSALARELGVNPGAARAQLHRALNRMRNAWGQHTEGNK